MVLSPYSETGQRKEERDVNMQKTADWNNPLFWVEVPYKPNMTLILPDWGGGLELETVKPLKIWPFNSMDSS